MPLKAATALNYMRRLNINYQGRHVPGTINKYSFAGVLVRG